MILLDATALALWCFNFNLKDSNTKIRADTTGFKPRGTSTSTYKNAHQDSRRHHRL
jgi:hypothetical protein